MEMTLFGGGRGAQAWNEWLDAMCTIVERTWDMWYWLARAGFKLLCTSH
jgi:hypothetical protein